VRGSELAARRHEEDADVGDGELAADGEGDGLAARRGEDGVNEEDGVASTKKTALPAVSGVSLTPWSDAAYA
jgi:hypothetical protein